MTYLSKILPSSVDRFLQIYGGFIIAFLTLWLYRAVGTFDFVQWDDYEYVVNNPYIRSLDGENLKKMFTDVINTGYMPITYLSFALEFAAWQLHAGGYHGVNVALHALNVLWVFILCQLWIGKDRVYAVLFITALFAIHPMKVQSVAWISERKDVLYSFFYLAGLFTYTHYLQQKGSKATLWYLLTAILTALAIGSKIAALSFFGAALVVDYLQQRPLSYRLILDKIPLILIPLSAFIYNAMAIGFDPTGTADPLDRILFFGTSLPYYIYTWLWPFNHNAIHLFPTSFGLFDFIWVGVSLLFTFSISWILIKKWKSQPLLVGGWLFFAVQMGLVLHLIRELNSFEMKADRYVYLAHIGLGMVAVSIYDQYLRNRMSGQGMGLIIIIWMVALSVSTHYQIQIWKNTETLFGYVLKKEPSSVYALHNIGKYHAEQGNTQKAYQIYQEVLRLSPGYPMTLLNRGLLFLEDGFFQDALRDFDALIRIEPDNAKAFNNRGLAYLRLREWDRAFSDLDQAIRLDPNFLLPLLNKAYAYELQGDIINAEKFYRLALDKSPTESKAYQGLAEIYLFQGDFPRAVGHYEKAVKFQPQNAEYLNGLGWALIQVGDPGSAILRFNEALFLDPKNDMIFNNRGYAHRMKGDPEAAYQDFQQALRLNPQQVYALYNLGLYYENLNQREDACGFFQQAAQRGHPDSQMKLETTCR